MNTKINRWIHGLSLAIAIFYVTVTSSGYMIVDLISIYLGIAIFTHLFVRKCDRKVRGLFSAMYGITFGYVTHIYGIPVVTAFLEEVAGIFYYSGGNIIVFYAVATIAGILFYNMSGKSNVTAVDKYGNETNLHMETIMITLLFLYYMFGSFVSS